MKIRLVLGAMAILLATAILPARADDTGTPPPQPPDGSNALAEECFTFAHQILRSRKMTPAALKMSAALYRAAVKLDPNEPRFSRSLIDNLLQMGDEAAAMNVLTEYRKLVPDDQSAQVQAMDLYLRSAELQSNDQRLAYLRTILYSKRISPEVRSEAAFRCYRVLADRADYTGALKMLDTAIHLNAFNITALRTRFVLTQDSASPVDRMTQMTAIFEANPTDAAVASRIAEQLAQLGAVDDSLKWYALAHRLYQTTMTPPDPAFLLGAASEYLIAGRAEEAFIPIAEYLYMAPDDPDGWYLLLSTAKYESIQDSQDKVSSDVFNNALRKSTIALTNRLQNVRLAIGESESTTRPLDAPSASVLPVLTNDLSLLSKATDPQMKPRYIEAVSALAWLDLFYLHDADAAQPLMDVLGKLLPKENPALGRLAGWQLLDRGDPAGAIAKFKPLAKDDPLSALGLNLANLGSSGTRTKGMVAAQRMLNEHPAGVLGAVAWVELSPYKASVEPSSLAKAASTVADNVPQSTIDLMSTPSAFYIASVEPVRSEFDFGEPIVVRVSLANIGPVPLPIGDLSPIKPEIWFDAYFRGMMEQSVPGAAIGRLDQRLVLMPGKQVSTLVRVDQDSLEPWLNDNPGINLGINLTIIVNPVEQKPSSPGQPPVAKPGLCGYSTQLASLIERVPTPVGTSEQRSNLMSRLNSEDGGERLRVIKVMALYAAQFRGNTDTQSIADQFIARIRKLRGLSKSVNAWKQYILEQLDDPGRQDEDIQEMSKSADWQSRLLSLLAVSVLDPARGTDLSGQLISDAEPAVSGFAAGLQDAEKASTTQPAAEVGVMLDNSHKAESPASNELPITPDTPPSQSPDATGAPSPDAPSSPAPAPPAQ
jgi:tetratricopeptide (TPR) repeat protein